MVVKVVICTVVLCVLDDIVGAELRQVFERLVLEASELTDLFMFPSQLGTSNTAVKSLVSEVESLNAW